MASDDSIAFRERLSVPWWGWPISLGVAAGLAVEIGLGVPGAVTWLPLALLVPGAAVLLLWLGRLRVGVEAGQLHVDDARLPLRFVDRVEPLSSAALRDALGAQLHPVAFVVQRPWIRGGVRVWLNDPDDPTPYWIVSTRRAEQLRDAVAEATSRKDDAAQAPSR
ncbi:MAG: DUF3093 domain-containing protein [Stackebrandtia sp.]